MTGLYQRLAAMSTVERVEFSTWLLAQAESNKIEGQTATGETLALLSELVRQFPVVPKRAVTAVER